MIRLWCRRHERNRCLCPDCQALIAYARDRLDRCPNGPDKPTCRLCTIHCYSPLMKTKITAVMRWAGPRMIIYHPVMAVRHLWRERPWSKRP